MVFDRTMTVPRPTGDETHDYTPPGQLPRAGGIQRGSLQLALTVSSFLLSLGGVAVSVYMFRTGLQALQHAETEVQHQTANRLKNEIQTTGVEADWAQRLTSLQFQNESLKTELIKSQSALARAEQMRNDADSRVAHLEAELKGIQLSLTQKTTGNQRLQAALADMTEATAANLECMMARVNESSAAFEKSLCWKGISFQPFLAHQN